MYHLRQLVSFLAIVSLAGIGSCRLSQPTGEIAQFDTYFASEPVPLESCGVKVTFLGASTLLFDDGETRFLVDAYFSRIPFWNLVLTRVQTDTVKVKKIIQEYLRDDLDAIFVTHTHFDHALDLGYVAKQTGAHVYGSESTRNICLGSDVRKDRIHEITDGSLIQLGQFEILSLSVTHSPMRRFMDDLGRSIEQPVTQPCHIIQYHEGGSFHLFVRHKGRSLYINPSANDQDQISDSLSAEVVFLGMGLMGHQDDIFRQNHFQNSVSKLGACLVIPIHWDNYCLPSEGGLDLIPASVSNTASWIGQAITMATRDDVEFHILQGGHSIRLFCEDD